MPKDCFSPPEPGKPQVVLRGCLTAASSGEPEELNEGHGISEAINA